MTNTKSYSDGDSIQILEGLEAVRKRPGMYIGSTGTRGLHHLINEIVDNSIDEGLAGYCNTIKITINKNESVTIEDNGRGIPTGFNHKAKMSALRVVFEILHAGAKFDNNAYKMSGGLHGVGASVVNALSSKLEATVWHNNTVSKVSYEKGKLKSEEIEKKYTGDKKGTLVTFIPDNEIFEETTFKYDTIIKRLRELAFLNKNIEIIFTDERKGITETLKYEGGLKEYIKFLNQSRVLLQNDIIYINDEKDQQIVEIALQYTDYFTENIFSYVNNIHTIDGGTHETGFRLALTKAFNDYAKKNGLIKESESFYNEDLSEGLTAIISIKIPDVEFEGQTKTKLGNSEAKKIVQNITYENLYSYLEKNSLFAKMIINKAKASVKARELIKKQKKVQNKKCNSMEKLTDATSKDRKKCELYIVEGDSAGGNAKDARDRETQAILPIRGKILNVEKQSIHNILDNEEIQIIETALGTGYGKECDVSKSNYGKIIIMCDADVDGSHIRQLILTYLYRQKKALFDNGMVYIAVPPLYKIITKKGTEKYIFNDKELEKEKIAIAKKNDSITTVKRFKGLGEMDADELRETTMNLCTRKIRRIIIDNDIYADNLISTLMGKQTDIRKQHVINNFNKTN